MTIHAFRKRPRGRGAAALALAGMLAILAAAGFVATRPPPQAQTAVASPEVSLVTRIVDGDTVDVRMDGEIVRVRLAEIDAPERNQAWGRRSEAVLSRLTLNKAVRIESRGRDRYGRMIGRLYVGEVDVSAAMIEEGCAWAYRQYLTDPRILTLETTARGKKAGLWAQKTSDIVAPWDWRRSRDDTTLASAEATPSPGPAGGFSCGSPRTCGQMTSCAEATFQLRQCGLKRLDRDGDGTPCESLCRPGG